MINNLYFINWNEIYARVSVLPKDKKYWGIPRGGTIVAGLTGRAVDTPEEADVIIDDLYDSGSTHERYREKYSDKKFAFLYNKKTEVFINNKWLVFPWEQKDGDKGINDNLIRILEYHNLPVTITNTEKLKKYLEGFKNNVG